MSQFQSLKNNPKEPIGFSSFNFQAQVIGYQGSPERQERRRTTQFDQLVFGILGVI